MNPKLITFAVITFLHDLFTVTWIGGLIVIAFTALPSARQVLGKGPEMKKLMDIIQKRQSLLVYISIVGLVLTGLLMARRTPAFEGLFTFGNAYSAVLTIKHLLVVAMILIALWRSLILGRGGGALTSSEEKLSARLLITNVVLGIAVLLVSGFVVALSSAPVVG